jgi:hypothetical protein
LPVEFEPLTRANYSVDSVTCPSTAYDRLLLFTFGWLVFHTKLLEKVSDVPADRDDCGDAHEDQSGFDRSYDK